MRAILSEFLDTVTVIDCSHKIALEDLYTKIPDLEDALQYHKALNHTMDYFLTYDIKLTKFSNPILPILNPADFLMLIDK